MSSLARRASATASLAFALALACAATAQDRPSPAPAAVPAPAVPAPAQARQATANDPVVATFEGGTVTKSEVLDFLGQYAILPEDREEAYEAAINALINQKLFSRFLEQQQVAVTAAELDAQVATLGQQLQQSGQGDLNSLMAEMSLTESELRERLTTPLRWNKYVRTKGDDATLQAYFKENEDFFTGTTVQASHILAAVEPDASEEAKQQARQKLVDLKQKIDAGELDFAVAADKLSEDPSNQETPDGGNIGYFGRRGQVVDAFADAAFALEVDQISDPVETEFGYHLIKVTDRRKGQDVTFEQIKDAVLATFGEETQQEIIEQARAQAKIDIKPMPEDFFPTTAPIPVVPVVPGAPAAAPAPAPAPAPPAAPANP